MADADINIIKSLDKKDLLLLSAYVDSQRKTMLDIHRRFNKKLEKDFHENVGEDITRHRLRYFEVIGLLKSESNKFGRIKGKGFDIIFTSFFSDTELSEELQGLDIPLEEVSRLNNENINHDEESAKLDLLLETDLPKKSCQFLINKK